MKGSNRRMGDGKQPRCKCFPGMGFDRSETAWDSADQKASRLSTLRAA